MKKHFFLSLLTIVLILSGKVVIFAQNNQPLYTARLGVQAYTFRKSFPISIPKTLDTIKMLGFTEMEGGGNKIPPADFKKLCDERGISIPSTGVGYDELVKSPDSIIYRAKIFGSKYVMCAWIPLPNGELSI